MKCPACGGEMTQHAKKVIYPRTDAEAALVDEELGGVVLESHACPACGKSASRIEEPGSPEPERRASGSESRSESAGGGAPAH